ncbi:MAG TPA: WD40 repeat domain-containing protein [Gemmatimonadota bacterium]|nr:WD40 repeat domain-containing protein [Gemmatimonadota bacterium]
MPDDEDTTRRDPAATGGRRDLVDWSDFLRGESLVLARHPELLFQQAMNRGDRVGPGRAATRRLADGRERRPWLRWFDRADGESGDLSLEAPPGAVRALAVSADGRRIVCATEDRVTSWDAATGRRVGAVEHGGGGCAIDPAGTSLLFARGERVSLHDLEGGLRAESPLDAEGAATCCRFSSEGARIAVGTDAGWVVVLDRETLRTVSRFDAHSLQRVVSCAFLPGEERLVTGSSGGVLGLWTLDGTELARHQAHREKVYSIAVSPDGRSILTCSGGLEAGPAWDFAVVPELYVWSAATGEREEILPVGQGYEIRACAWSPRGDLLASGGTDRVVTIWDARSFDRSDVFTGHAGDIEALAFSRDGSQLASASPDGSVRVWRMPSPAVGEPRRRNGPAWSRARVVPDVEPGATAIRRYPGRVGGCRFSRDGALALLQGWSGQMQGMLVVLDTRDRSTRATFYEHMYGVGACDASPTGDRAISIGVIEGDGIRILDLGTQSVVADAASEDDHEDRPTACAWVRDDRVASGSAGGILKLWNAAAELVATRDGGPGEIRALAASESGDRFASASGAGTLRLWDAEDGRALAVLEGHHGPVTACAFSGDGRRLVSRSDDRTVRLWDTDSGASIAVLGEQADAVFDEAGRRLVTLGPRSVGVWDPESCTRLHEVPIPALRSAPGLRLCSVREEWVLLVLEEWVVVLDLDGCEVARQRIEEGILGARFDPASGAIMVVDRAGVLYRMRFERPGSTEATPDSKGPLPRQRSR